MTGKKYTPVEIADFGRECPPEQLAESYLRGGWPTTDDPIDHCMRIVEMAAVFGGRGRAFADKALSEFDQSEVHEATSVHKSLASMIASFSHLAFSLCPSRSVEDWTRVIDLVLSHLYGGTRVYIKGKTNTSKESVKHMTPKQIMEKFGVSRSYAYQLLKKK